MKINRLVIENFKSIERIELVEPNPFTVFLGPNGSGKSNIFEALEFVNYQAKNETLSGIRLFGGRKSILNRHHQTERVNDVFHFRVDFDSEYPSHSELTLNLLDTVEDDWIGVSGITSNFPNTYSKEGFDIIRQSEQFTQFYRHFARLFIGNSKILRIDFQDEQSLNSSASNLEKVLKRILANSVLRDEIFEWLELFVPGFKAVEVDDRDELHWFESSSSEYFTKDLISDGTYNILALLTAVYQSDDKPQFLCIEEPENGLHPQVMAEFVNLCRYACEEFGHFIWLNTHSESLVRKLKTEDIVLVDKRDGATQIKQVKDMNLHDLPMDEAWLSNALGGGTPW